MSARNVDLDKFRLRSFVEKLIAIGEMEVHEEAVSLADLSAVIGSSLGSTAIAPFPLARSWRILLRGGSCAARMGNWCFRPAPAGSSSIATS